MPSSSLGTYNKLGIYSYLSKIETLFLFKPKFMPVPDRLSSNSLLDTLFEYSIKLSQ